MTERSLVERLTELERRVTRLESGGTPRQVPDTETFWALEALKQRMDAPGGVLFTGAVDLPTGEHIEWQQGYGTEDLLADDWSARAPVFGALAHPVRLLLLREILHGARTTAELSAHERLGTTGQLYHHLRQLASAGWLRATARGQYTIPGERVVPLLVALAATRR